REDGQRRRHRDGHRGQAERLMARRRSKTMERDRISLQAEGPPEDATTATPSSPDPAAPGRPAAVTMGLGWSAALERRPRGAALCIQHPDQAAITVEITITARGPVIRAAAAAL